MALALALAGWLLVAGFMIWLLTYCLRAGAVGGWASRVDAHRDKQPLRFWIGILGLAGGAAMMIFLFVYVVWDTLLH